MLAVTTFGLVPGAWHGAWAFERLVPRLRDLGHDAIAIDLPCDDPSAGFDAYVAVALRALEGVAPDDLVLVGHSLGAHTAVRVAIERPVRELVFVCGVIPPREGERGPEPEMEEPHTFDGLAIDDAGRMWWPDPADAVAAMYADCDPDDAAWAAARLQRQSRTPHERLGEVLAWPEAPMRSIVCTDDRVVRAEWGRWAARERLDGAPVHELPGGHSPFVSRAADLADLLVR